MTEIKRYKSAIRIRIRIRIEFNIIFNTLYRVILQCAVMEEDGGMQCILLGQDSELKTIGPQ